MSVFIGVPRKGRNAGIALRDIGKENADPIIEILNGSGKKAAKTGEGLEQVKDEVDQTQGIEMRDTGRAFQRPVIESFKLDEFSLESFETSPFEQDFDGFYAGYDELLELEGYNGKVFRDEVEDIAAEYGFTLESELGDEVKWGVFNNGDLDRLPDKVLISEEFENLSKSLAQQYWGSDVEFELYQDYSSKLDEEEIIAETSQETAGIYMFVSGNEADKNNLNYEAIPGALSQLGKFSRKNQYKNSGATKV